VTSDRVQVDITRFPTPASLASWARSRPGINSLAGKTGRSTKQRNRYLVRPDASHCSIRVGISDRFHAIRARDIWPRPSNAPGCPRKSVEVTALAGGLSPNLSLGPSRTPLRVRFYGPDVCVQAPPGGQVVVLQRSNGWNRCIEASIVRGSGHKGGPRASEKLEARPSDEGQPILIRVSYGCRLSSASYAPELSCLSLPSRRLGRNR
jgi:hypothetical protein